MLSWNEIKKISKSQIKLSKRFKFTGSTYVAMFKAFNYLNDPKGGAK